MNDQIIVAKGNDLIAASYSLSVREQRLLLAAISLIYPKGEMPKEIIVTAEYYAALFNVSNPYRDMNEAVKKLFDRYLVFENDLEKGKVRWLSEIGVAKNGGHVRVVFTDEMIPYLSLLSGRFSSYDIRRITKLTSVYAIRLFEMLIRFKTTGIFNIGLDALVNRLDLPPSYRRMSNLRSKVLDLALEDINKHTGLRVVYEVVKDRKVVTGISFRFSDSWVDYPAIQNQKTKKLQQEETQTQNHEDDTTATKKRTSEVSAKADEPSPEDMDGQRRVAREEMNRIKQLLGRKFILPTSSSDDL